MDLQISVFLLLILFTRGHSLSCYECPTESGSCNQTTCPTGFTNCSSVTIAVNSTTVIVKGCAPDGCLNGSVNLDAGQVNPICCNTNLCNTHSPDPSNNTSNGKSCYYCVGQSCSNTVSCSGSEDHCITATVFSSGTLRNYSQVVKGCVSESICNASAFIPNVNDVSCCEGNLCNGAQNSTQNPAQSSTQSATQSSTRSTTQSATQSPARSSTQSATQNSTRSATQSPAENSTQSATQSPARSSTQSATQSPARSSTQSATQNSTRSATQSPAENSTQSATQSPARSSTQSATPSPARSSTQSATQSPARSSTQSANAAQSVIQSFLFLCCSLLSFILLH